MSGELEAIGEAVTGGMLGRAVEPTAGEADGHTHEKRCLNCGCDLTGPYCQCCGQQAHVHRTLGAFFHDLLHGVFHFEGKIWRTLPKLAWRPGELTRDYIGGQRARFVSPVALFLFSVFLMFAIVSLVGGPLHFNSTPEASAETKRDLAQAQTENLAELKALETRRATMAKQGEPTAEVDREIARMRKAIDLQATIFESMGAQVQSAPETPTGNVVGEKVTAAADATIPGWFDAAYMKAKENPKLLLYKVQNSAYKFSWALIPISVPFVWLLFLHRRRYRQYRAYDHTVFVTYSLAFMTLGFIALSLLRAIGLPGWVAGWAIALVPPVHMYRQLRGAYALGRFSALWRTAVLIVFAFTASIIFMALLLFLGVLG
ncbi:DUF3667 domain-containing protein [Sphingomonas sinipercae]|uniref:DUF3667 domain-containing protein n=1 Tax=Sphingomonas sinipercae TaxID=2714944 RepID=A0A6G7ZQE5_9SPHN|nr:DUF3667 domain-containing protein [Sphingomonas sinipercae]QIL03163.1 DUF3667 domain-containing protein [Sphingomonas sinipercae]